LIWPSHLIRAASWRAVWDELGVVSDRISAWVLPDVKQQNVQGGRHGCRLLL